MTRKKNDFFDLETIQEMCETYANDGISMTELGKRFNVTREKIRTIFAKAIIFRYVDLELANKMKDVAVKNNFEAAMRNGILPNESVENYYLNLINARNERKEASDKIDYIRFTLEVYDDNFSCDDDYPYSKEALLDELAKCKEIIKKAEEMV